MRQFLRVPQRIHNAVIIMADLAEQPVGGLLSLKEVAARNGLSRGFLEEIVVPLREAGLVAAKRGAAGGYALARPAAKISVGDIVIAVEGPVAFVDCLAGGGCPAAECCSTRLVWERVQERVEGVMAEMTLAELVGQKR